MGALGRLKQLAARLCKGFCLDGSEKSLNGYGDSNLHHSREGENLADSDDATMQVRQALLTAQEPAEFFDRLHALREGLARNMRYDPSRLANLNGSKETEIKSGDQFAGR